MEMALGLLINEDECAKKIERTENVRDSRPGALGLRKRYESFGDVLYEVIRRRWQGGGNKERGPLPREGFLCVCKVLSAAST